MEDLYLDSLYEDVMIDGVLRRLHQGFTTGSCAQAGTQGALLLLARQDLPSDVVITLPIGKRAHVPVYGYSRTQLGDEASCTIQKNGGDDPDVTHGALITVTVKGTPTPGITLDGGEGVGRVTRPGLGIAVGAAAINRVPHKMIMLEARRMVDSVLGPSWLMSYPGLQISVSVENGENIATQTYNPRLGIVGGLSILGTTGLVRPYSLSSWKASVVLASKVACENSTEVVFVPGSRSKQWADSHFSSLPPQAIVEVSRFFGYALRVINIRPSVRRVVFVSMAGKLTKVAQGALDLHANESTIDLHMLMHLAAESGVNSTVLEQMQQLTTASAIVKMGRSYHRFLENLTREAWVRIASKLRDGVTVEVYLIDSEGCVLASTTR